MQTFLPVVIDRLPMASFTASAAVLDRQRLGKQRVEALQILNTLTGVSDGWRNHPAVRMWRGYESALSLYGRCMCVEWASRGYVDNLLARFPQTFEETFPDWMWDPAFSASHRSNLLRKNAEWYGQFGWTEPPTLPYVWPAKHR